MTDYAKEYDDLVEEYNNWLYVVLADPELRGGTNLTKMFTFIKIHPEYFKHEFSPQQVEAVAFGANWKRISESIDLKVADHRTSEKNFADKYYDFYREDYIMHAKK